jgi:hypothetical protein
LYGVPQGSILGPLLFLLYINDFQFASTLTSLLYADDTSLFNESSCLETLFCETNSELINVSQWFSANRLTLHPAKTRYMLFSHPKPTDLQLILIRLNALEQIVTLTLKQDNLYCYTLLMESIRGLIKLTSPSAKKPRTE